MVFHWLKGQWQDISGSKNAPTESTDVVSIANTILDRFSKYNNPSSSPTDLDEQVKARKRCFLSEEIWIIFVLDAIIFDLPFITETQRVVSRGFVALSHQKHTVFTLLQYLRCLVTF